MMRIGACGVVMMALGCGYCAAQTSGNIGYGQNGGKAKAEQIEHSEKVLTAQELPPGKSSMFVDADVLMNVKADEYVAVFGVSQEGGTVEEANAKMNATLKKFTDAVKTAGVRDADIYVDFITQPKVYGYTMSGNTAKEKLTGFELKKNVSIHYRERDLLDRLMTMAAAAEIYDLIKVDYVVKDIPAVHAALMREASALIKQKLADERRLLGVQTRGPAAVYAERTAIHYPTELYDSYTAAESESLTPLRNNGQLTVQQARKSRTFYFDPLQGDGFDKVINPVVIEPVVQFTLYLKVKYEVGP